VKPKILYFQGWRLTPLRVWSLNRYALVPPFLPILKNPLKYSYWNCQQLHGYFVLRCFHIIQYFEYQNLANAVFRFSGTLFYINWCTYTSLHAVIFHGNGISIVTAFRTSYSTRLSKGTKKKNHKSHIWWIHRLSLWNILCSCRLRGQGQDHGTCASSTVVYSTQEVKTCHKLV